MRFSLAATVVATAFLRGVTAGLPDKIYGVNLGSWLVLEPWMLPQGMESTSIIPPARSLTLLRRVDRHGR